MSSRIEQIIEEIEEYIDSCKFQPLSTTKIIVNKDQMDELLRELRMRTPEEIKRYQKIIANKDAILADAQNKADNMQQLTRHRRFWIMRQEMRMISVSERSVILMICLPMQRALLDIHWTATLQNTMGLSILCRNVMTAYISIVKN